MMELYFMDVIEEAKNFILSNLRQADIGCWTLALVEVSDFSAVCSSIRLFVCPEDILRTAH